MPGPRKGQRGTVEPPEELIQSDASSRLSGGKVLSEFCQTPNLAPQGYGDGTPPSRFFSELNWSGLQPVKKTELRCGSLTHGGVLSEVKSVRTES